MLCGPLEDNLRFGVICCLSLQGRRINRAIFPVLALLYFIMGASIILIVALNHNLCAYMPMEDNTLWFSFCWYATAKLTLTERNLVVSNEYN
jgi:hypothetical protein